MKRKLIRVNFYFNCHGQFSLHKFSNTHVRTQARTHAHLENPYIEVGRAHLKIARLRLSCDSYCTMTESTKLNNYCMLLNYN